MQIILIFSSEISSNKQGSVTVWMLRQVINKRDRDSSQENRALPTSQMELPGVH